MPIFSLRRRRRRRFRDTHVAVKVARRRRRRQRQRRRRKSSNVPFLMHRPLTFMRLRARTRYAAAAGASARMHSGDFPGQVPRRYSRGCTRHRSWCFQHPHPHARLQTRSRTDTGASVRGNAPSYFLTIASRSPRGERITYSLVHRADTRDTGCCTAAQAPHVFMNFLLIFLVSENSAACPLSYSDAKR